MSEIKRAVLFTTALDNPDEKTKSLRPASKTVRLQLNLFEPTADSFPEFNYNKLLHQEKKKRKKVAKDNGNILSDPFEDEGNNDVERIAKEFEKKYGNSSSYGKKPTKQKECDKGAGYDESDSFIDNAEAYDELIPDEVETVCGGFYINSGPLEFKQIPNFERPDDCFRMPKPKKRILSSSSESSDDESGDSDSTSKNLNKPKNGHVDKKQKTTSSDELKKIHKTKEKKVEKSKKEGTESDSGSHSAVSKEKVIKTTTVKDMLRAKRDSMLNMKSGESGLDSDKNDSSSSDGSTDSSDDENPKSDNPDVQIKSDDGTKKVNPKPIEEVKLPNNLPEELLKDIHLMKKEAAQNAQNGGKSSFFDTKICEILLRIEIATRSCGGSVRNQVYSYLEHFLPCTKQTLLVRAKKIRISQEEIKMNRASNKFKKIIDEMVPQMVKNYEAECVKVVEMRAALNASNTGPEEKPDNLIKMPRRRFPWNDSLRDSLCELIKMRRDAFSIIKPRKETLEEYCVNYMKQHILPMFPTGWVKYDDLNKEIEKRKPKKPKENKKPVIAAATSTTSTTAISTVTSTDSKSINNNKVKETNSNNSKSVLSTSNSVLKTKDVSVKKNSTPPLPISTGSISNNISNSKTSESSSKKTNSVPTGYSSSLTITAVTSTATNLTKSYTNVQNKVTITNIDSSSAVPAQITNLIKNAESVTSKSKTPPVSPSTVIKSSSTPKLPSSLSISITPTVNSPNSSINPTTTATTTTKLDNSQRRTSDYSINSIMSVAAPQKSPENLQKKTSEKTQLINLDSLKNKDELVQHLSSNSTKDNLLKVRSVDHMNNKFSGSSDNNNSKNSNKSDPITTISSEDDVCASDSSDGVEIVGVFPVSSSKKHKTKNKNNIIVNKSKYAAAVDPLLIDSNIKSSSSRSNKGCDDFKISKPFSIPVTSDTDVDVIKIMKELKELEYNNYKNSSHTDQKHRLVESSSPTSYSGLPPGIRNQNINFPTLFKSNDVPISTIVESQFLVPNLLSYSEVLNRSSTILNTANSDLTVNNIKKS